jgi:uncharacterized protein YjiS (DUF1127 family)
MGRNTISRYEIGVRRRIGGRTLGIFGRIWKALRNLRERIRERRELAALSQRDLADLGIPPGLAAYEASRWPWQKISSEWRELDEAGGALSPGETVSADPPRDQERGAAPAKSALARGRV